ncbi:MAG TPA: phosphoribosylamine--glycine ligase [Candidatus Omnitrophota bacterium]|nr:phosphoribosylamine--glycine ligase [Candidatus Omnitrophota bacterium]HPS37330.1 phosphoribosylamine--glycine ligase [Candidatus Omnitrophota bacterium]
MKVLLVGSGGREHALAWKIAQSPLLTKLYAAPGNAGISQYAECVPIASDNVDGLLEFALREKIDFTVVGPESPLVAGIVDRFHEKGLKTFGPGRDTARLEGSKAFSKDLMTKYGVPTAAYEIFTNVNEAKHYVIESEMPIVIKADGLAAGKGVVICDTSEQAVATLTQIMEERIFGEAGAKVVIEKKLEGEEISVLVLTDGEKIIPLASASDHKRAYDHDRGPNTGGMGAFSPSMRIPESELGGIIDLAVRPIVKGLAQDGTPFRGVLYAGLMITKDGPFVLEYNCRFGDPETEVILPRMKSDLLPIMMQIAEGRLASEVLDWYPKACITVVMASGGYPGSYEKGFPIHGLDSAKHKEDILIFHAGTAWNAAKQVVTAGGRVLAVTALGENLKAAHDRAYQAVSQIHFDGGFSRRDIGYKAIEVLK